MRSGDAKRFRLPRHTASKVFIGFRVRAVIACAAAPQLVHVLETVGLARCTADFRARQRRRDCAGAVAAILTAQTVIARSGLLTRQIHRHPDFFHRSVGCQKFDIEIAGAAKGHKIRRLGHRHAIVCRYLRGCGPRHTADARHRKHRAADRTMQLERKHRTARRHAVQIPNDARTIRDAIEVLPNGESPQGCFSASVRTRLPLYEERQERRCEHHVRISIHHGTTEHGFKRRPELFTQLRGVGLNQPEIRCAEARGVICHYSLAPVQLVARLPDHPGTPQRFHA